MYDKPKPFLYVLNGEGPVPTDNILAWCDWFQKADRTVVRTKVGDGCVLTSFTGRERASLQESCFLWETTIFGGAHHGMGQIDTSEMSARDAHILWLDVALGKITSNHVKSIIEHSWRIADGADDRAKFTDESTTWLLYHEVQRLLDTDEKTITHWTQLGMLHPRSFSYTDPFEERRYYGYGPKPKPRIVEFYDLAEIIDVCRRNKDLPRYGWRHAVALPQHLKPLHAAMLDRYVTPGVISLLEFRVRYGYQCKRFGKRYRYRLLRADGTTVCIESSPIQAWKVAHHLERFRLAPILIARDALAEGRVKAAQELAETLEADLAEPLLREIKLVSAPPASTDSDQEDR